MINFTESDNANNNGKDDLIKNIIHNGSLFANKSNLNFVEIQPNPEIGNNTQIYDYSSNVVFKVEKT